MPFGQLARIAAVFAATTLTAGALGACGVLADTSSRPLDPPTGPTGRASRPSGATAAAGPRDPKVALAAAPAAVRAAGTTKIHLTTVAKGASSSPGATVDGVVDFRSGDEQLTLSGATGFPGARFIVVVKDGQGYTRWPVELSPGKAWVTDSAPRSSETGPGGDSSGIDVVDGDLSDVFDASRVLTAAVGSITGVRDAGTAAVAGHAARHITATLAPGQVLDAVPTLDGSTGIGPAALDFYLDARGRTVRIAATVRVAGYAAPEGNTGATTVTTTVDFTAFGNPVRVVAPPASQVGEFPLDIGRLA